MGFNLKRFTRRIIATALAGAMTVSLLPLGGSKTASAASDAVINVNTTYQESMGYGGMNHPTWAGDLTYSQRETAFGNGNNQLGFQVLRIWVDSNSTRNLLQQRQQLQRELLYLQHLGIHLQAFVKNLPVMVNLIHRDFVMTNMHSMHSTLTTSLLI